MKVNQQSARFTAPLLATVLLFSANISLAQEASQGAAQSTTPPSQQQPSPNGGVSIDPSAGPLAPSATPPAATPPTEMQPPATQPAQAPLPNAHQPATSPAPTQPSQNSARPTAQVPLGAAAAEQVRTTGGSASRPAGNAIAPAKQHQYRSLIIKLGAVAAAGIAVGTVYGLSRATPSTPPHAASAAVK